MDFLNTVPGVIDGVSLKIRDIDIEFAACNTSADKGVLIPERSLVRF
jgi:hypothetical protein